MRVLILIVAMFFSACGGTSQTTPISTAEPTASGTPQPKLSPLPDNIGLILECNKCVFIEEQGSRYIAGEIHNKAKQVVSGYEMAVDLQDGTGASLKKIPALMLMKAIVIQPDESVEFKEKVISNDANITQAVIYLKKAGKDVKLSNTLILKLNGPPYTQPTKSKGSIR